MRIQTLLCSSLLVAVTGTAAIAQPAKNEPASGSKSDAKALMASGLKLFQAKDYLGALAVFRDAYGRFASPKILLNIATTLKQLNRNAEAANTYQRYLDAQDTDVAKKADVTKVLAELDTKLAIIEVAVKPSDAELQFTGDDEWHPAADVARYRVAPGKIVARARAEKFAVAEVSVETVAGRHFPLSIILAPIPDAPVVTAPVTDPTISTRETLEPTTPRTSSRLGAYVLAHIDIANAGGAARVGATFEIIPRLQAELGAIIGPVSGGYVGARYAFLPGRFRPVLAVGMPMFVEDGAHVAIRGAAGLDVVLSPHISIVVEAGVERVLNPGMNYVETVFVPAIGAAGRL